MLFYCVFWGFTQFDSYQTAINAIICLSPKQGEIAQICKHKRDGPVKLGDTDTNAAIAGALLGAYYGVLNMCNDPTSKQNLRVLLHANPNLGDIKRPRRYTMNGHNFKKLVKIALTLYLENLDV